MLTSNSACLRPLGKTFRHMDVHQQSDANSDLNARILPDISRESSLRREMTVKRVFTAYIIKISPFRSRNNPHPSNHCFYHKFFVPTRSPRIYPSPLGLLVWVGRL